MSHFLRGMQLNSAKGSTQLRKPGTIWTNRCERYKVQVVLPCASTPPLHVEIALVKQTVGLWRFWDNNILDIFWILNNRPEDLSDVLREDDVGTSKMVDKARWNSIGDLVVRKDWSWSFTKVSPCFTCFDVTDCSHAREELFQALEEFFPETPEASVQTGRQKGFHWKTGRTSFAFIELKRLSDINTIFVERKRERRMRM